jgi:hypothetical protein
MVIGLAFVSLGSAACAARRAPVDDFASPDAAALRSNPELGSALDRMRGAFELGDEDRARAELDSARGLDPEHRWDVYFGRFEAVLNGRALARSLDRSSRIESVRDQATLGDPIHVRMVLVNDGVPGKVGKLEIPKETGGGIFSSSPKSITRLIASIATKEYGAYGDERERIDTLPVALRENVVIPEGGTFQMDFAFEDYPEGGVVARVFEIGAEIVPATVVFAGSPVFLTKIRCASCSVVALPPGYEAFATKPVESLASLLEKSGGASDRSILPCAMLVAREARDEATLLLAKKLVGAQPQRALAIIVALRYLTGDRERGLDRASWIGFAAKLLDSQAR